MSVPFLILFNALVAAPVMPQPTPAPPKVTVDGCVATGKEAGRKPDLAEKTGLDEHFVLLDAKVVRGKGPVAASGADATAAPRSMFKISGLTDEQLKIHVGRRVRVEGRFGSLEEPATTPDAPQDNLVELTVATIRQVAGTCPVPRG